MTTGEAILAIFLLSVGLVLIVCKLLGCFDKPEPAPLFPPGYAPADLQNKRARRERNAMVDSYRAQHPSCAYCEHCHRDRVLGMACCLAKKEKVNLEEPTEKAKSCPIYEPVSYEKELQKEEELHGKSEEPPHCEGLRKRTAKRGGV